MFSAGWQEGCRGGCSLGARSGALSHTQLLPRQEVGVLFKPLRQPLEPLQRRVISSPAGCSSAAWA